MALKSQDVLVVLKLLSDGERASSYAVLAQELRMSASEVHASVGRLREGRLVSGEGRRVMRKVLADFLSFGLSPVFPAREGELARGIPTAWAAPSLHGEVITNGEPAPVWAHPEGSERGTSVVPLYRSAPQAALADPVLYEYLALVDSVRLGRARERRAAIEKINHLLLSDG